MDNIIIYVLKLENQKYYIGKTKNSNARVLQHFNGNASVWTTKYKPLEVVQIINDCDSFDEDKITLQYMKKYGINNVRGGSFATLELDENTIAFITRMIRGSTDCCYHCGGPHFVKDCKQNNSDDWTLIDSCSKCKRIGHNADKCYARGIVHPDTYFNPQQNIACFKQKWNFLFNLFRKK